MRLQLSLLLLATILVVSVVALEKECVDQHRYDPCDPDFLPCQQLLVNLYKCMYDCTDYVECMYICRSNIPNLEDMLYNVTSHCSVQPED